MNDDWQNREMGALWKEEGRDGNYYAGFVKVEGKSIRVVCFPNKKKTEERQPDIRIYESKEKNR